MHLNALTCILDFAISCVTSQGPCRCRCVQVAEHISDITKATLNIRAAIFEAISEGYGPTLLIFQHYRRVACLEDSRTHGRNIHSVFRCLVPREMTCIIVPFRTAQTSYGQNIVVFMVVVLISFVVRLVLCHKVLWKWFEVAGDTNPTTHYYGQVVPSRRSFMTCINSIRGKSD